MTLSINAEYLIEYGACEVCDNWDEDEDVWIEHGEQAY